MNQRKFGRFLGTKAWNGQLPLVQMQLPLSHLAMFPASGGVADGPVGSWFGHVQIDPPVGGFAADDILLQAPNVNSYQLVTAVMVPSLSRHFEPGIYDISAGFGFTAAGFGLEWAFFNADPAGGWAIHGVDAPRLGFACKAATATQLSYRNIRMYFAGKWYG